MIILTRIYNSNYCKRTVLKNISRFQDTKIYFYVLALPLNKLGMLHANFCTKKLHSFKKVKDCSPGLARECILKLDTAVCAQKQKTSFRLGAICWLAFIVIIVFSSFGSSSLVSRRNRPIFIFMTIGDYHNLLNMRLFWKIACRAMVLTGSSNLWWQTGGLR